MTSVTVAEVLDMPVVRAARPEVLAGRGGLDREVRWVHSGELEDIGPLLRGGDLLLSTGIALPDSPEGLAAFAASLRESDVAGLVIELGRRWTSLPAALVEACDSAGLPLVSLGRQVRFATVAQAIGERIVDEQLSELREAQRVHDVFTELSVEEAGPARILDAVQRLSGATVVLESDQHQVLEYLPGPGDVDAFLADWAERSRQVRVEGRTGWDRENQWLVTRLGKRERRWGRLVVQCPAPPSSRLVAVAERAAAALALHRLHDRHRDSLVRRSHHELLLALMADPTPEVLRRCELAGVPHERRTFVGLSIRPRPRRTAGPAVPGTLLDEVIGAVVHAAHELGAPALVSPFDQDIRVLLSLPRSAGVDRVVDELAERVSRRYAVVVAAGRPGSGVADLGRTLREAQQVVEAVRGDATTTVVRLDDVHLRGLLTLLGDDERVALFAARELDLLRAHDAAHDTRLLEAVRALVTHPTGKTAAAASLHVSRPVFYDRLAKAERVLGARLDDPDIRVSLHVALVADELGLGAAT